MDMNQKREIGLETQKNSQESQPNERKTNLNWFPGHMAKARREISEKLSLVDIVIVILDARIPLSSMNPMMSDIIKDKPKLYLLNKASLADRNVTASFISYFTKQNITALDIDLIDNYNLNKIYPKCQAVLADKIARSKERGFVNFKIRALVIGIPNVGKSTFINTMAKKRILNVGDKPGVTKKLAWVKVNENFELLDTPGVLWPKFESETVANNLALSGAIKDEVLPLDEVISYGLVLMQKYYPENLFLRYGVKITKEMDLLTIFEAIGRKKNWLSKGNEVDYDRVINMVLFDLRHNKLGAMSYDRCED